MSGASPPGCASPRSVRATDSRTRAARSCRPRPRPPSCAALVARACTDIEVTSFVRRDRDARSSPMPPRRSSPDARPAAGGRDATARSCPTCAARACALEPPGSSDKVGHLHGGVRDVQRGATSTPRSTQSFERFQPVIAEARAGDGLPMRGYISAPPSVCPYEGPVDAIAGAREVACWNSPARRSAARRSRSATRSAPARRATSRACSRSCWPTSSRGPPSVVLHFHDTRGMAVANTSARACAIGVASGTTPAPAALGGCPFAPGAAGNLATEDLVFLLDGLGIETGVRSGAPQGGVADRGAVARADARRQGVSRTAAQRSSVISPSFHTSRTAKTVTSASGSLTCFRTSTRSRSA